MTPTARRMTQIVLVATGLLLGGAIAAGQVWLSSGVCAAADGIAREALLLAMAGGALQVAGIIGMTVGAALGLPPGLSSPLVPGGIRGRTRALRQIAGKEPYRTDEIEQLRRLAEHGVSSSRPSPAHGVIVFGLVLGFVGTLLGAATVYLEGAVMAGVVLSVASLGIAALGVMLPRLVRRGAANAEAFLQRTQSVAPHASGGH